MDTGGSPASRPAESEPGPGITALLAGARRGDKQAVNQLFTSLYADLRRLAHGRMQRHDVPTLLDTTSLVHESYLRFLKAGHIEVGDRPHFLAYAARVMRSVVVDFARERGAQRRGGETLLIQIHTGMEGSLAEPATEILSVNRALDALAAVSERLVSVVEMRYFAGMSEAEIASALGLTERTVRRDWEKARLILAAALK